MIFTASLHAQAPVFRPLHVSSAGIIQDDLGHPVVLHGLNRSATGYGNADANATDRDYQQQNQLLSMNVVRIFVNSAWWTNNVPVPIAGTTYQNYIDQLIQRAKKYGNYVLILKAGQFPDAPCGASGVNCPTSNQGDLNCQANSALCFDQDTTGAFIFDALQFWNLFTQRYASDPAILYDTWENMRGLDSDTWRNNQNQLIATIRMQSPGSLIFVGDTGTAFEAVVAGGEPDLALPNLVWNFHLYNGPAGSCNDPVSSRNASFPVNFDPLVNYAQQNGHAVVLSEWGGCNDTEPYHTNITSYARIHSVGLIYFDSSYLITVAGGVSQLTAVGAQVAQVYAGLTGCAYAFSAGGQAFPPEGGKGILDITTSPGCAWSGLGLPAWVTEATTGVGSGTFTYQVAVNTGLDRSATITIAGTSFTIEQETSSIVGLTSIGSMAHIAAEGGWTTAFTLVNKGTSAMARLSLFGDPSDPTGNGPLTVPLAFPQQPASPGPLLAATFDRTISTNASLVIDTAGPQTLPVLTGSAQLGATGVVDGFAIFRQTSTAQEAVVPMETRHASSYLLAFDNTKGVAMGVAVANLSSQSINIGVVIRDDTGAQIPTLVPVITLAGSGHKSFVLSDPASGGFAETANIRGTIEFDAPPGIQISVLGIRSTPPNHALTTIPALLVNVGTGGGSIAHIASGNGWQTTFVLVNTGATAAQIHLKFFADLTGAPLSLPLAFPQPGGGAATVASSVDQTLAAGATLLIQSAGLLSDPLPTTGSAQLTTNGNVGGFVIFRFNPNGQEAVVPLETRNANAYILAFDNTGGRATGIAINVVSSQQVTVPVVVRNDAGNQIDSDTLTLAGNAHLSFVLGNQPNNKYPATAGIRGTIEFDSPVAGQVGAMGIRNTGQAFTTLPALVK